MEFFRNVNVDWMGKAKYFVILSLVLLAVGWLSVLRHGGLSYGIDFRGGTLVYVRFAQPPSLDKVRKSLADAGIPNSTIQQISDISDPSSRNDVVIGLEQQGQGDESLDAGKQKIVDILQKTHGGAATGKPDFNSATPSDLAAYLTQRDPLRAGVNASDRYAQVAQQLTDARDKNFGGVVTGFSQLKSAGVPAEAVDSVATGYSLGQFTIRNVEIVGPRVGAQLRRQAILATLYALAGMLVYIAFRFEWVFGAAAVIAVFHDVLITLGFFSLFHYEISLTVIAALLTLVGYSMNDTIVIFDRVRENMRLMKRESLSEIVNKSINQTLSRTILTSGLTFLTVIVLYVMGGEVLRAFAFAMVVGVIVGTYSSFGIAAPIVVLWNKYHPSQGAVARSTAPAGKRIPAAARR